MIWIFTLSHPSQTGNNQTTKFLLDFDRLPRKRMYVNNSGEALNRTHKHFKSIWIIMQIGIKNSREKARKVFNFRGSQARRATSLGERAHCFIAKAFGVINCYWLHFLQLSEYAQGATFFWLIKHIFAIAGTMVNGAAAAVKMRLSLIALWWGLSAFECVILWKAFHRHARNARAKNASN